MSDLTSEFLSVLVTAPDDRKREALRILRGESPTPPKRETEAFLTLKECARRLGVSACSLWRWRVPGHDLGGRPKFRISEVETYLASAEFQRRAAELRAEEQEKRGRAISGQ